MQKYDPLCRGNVDRDYTGRDTLLTGERIVLVDITALVYAMSVVLDRLVVYLLTIMTNTALIEDFASLSALTHANNASFSTGATAHCHG